MIFELVPTLDTMKSFYQKPKSIERFQEYLNLLKGNTKDDLGFPITNFNPMAKEHVVSKIEELIQLNAEAEAQYALKKINQQFQNSFNNMTFKVVLTIADDLMGGWTNRYTTDYDGKFKLLALIKRQFCTPVFWSSENYTTDLIHERTMQYALRSIYQLKQSKIITLQDHIEQEQFVYQHSPLTYKTDIDFNIAHTYFKQFALADEYHIIFNFLYGSEASYSLNFPSDEIFENMNGFIYAAKTI